MERTFWNTNGPLDLDSGDENTLPEQDRHQVSSEQDAVLVGSRLKDSELHAPVIDIDLPCRLVPSTTEGHFHLYIDKELTWEQYRLLLAVLADLGIVERGYYRASARRGQTFVRKPGLKKEAATSGNYNF